MKRKILKILTYLVFAWWYYESLVRMVGGSFSLVWWLWCTLMVLGSIGSAYGVLWMIQRGIQTINPKLSKWKKNLCIWSGFVFIIAIVWFPVATTMLQCVHFKVGNPSTDTIVEPFFPFTTTTSDGYQISWILLDAHAPDTILLAHGLGANRNNFHLQARSLYYLGYNVASFDFRAHGESDGILTSFWFHETKDIIAVEKYLRSHYPQKTKRLFWVGYSMGGAAMLLAQSQYPILDKMVMDSSFARSEDMIDHAYRFFPWWYRTYLKKVWNQLTSLLIGKPILEIQPREVLTKLPTPVMLIHCQNDTMIPVSQSKKLHQANPKTRLEIFPNCGHVGALFEDGERYEKVVKEFFIY